jgi:hypothetical protein
MDYKTAEDLKAFCISVKRGETPEITSAYPDTSKEVLHLFTCFEQAKKWFAGFGITAMASGSGNIAVNGFDIKAGKHTFRIHPPGLKKPMKKGVAETSIMAYQSLDIRGQVEKVAKAAIRLSSEKGFCTDSEVAQIVNIPQARVSARRAAMQNGVVIGGVPYVLTGKGRVKCTVTQNTVNGWALTQLSQGGRQEQLF